jgi:hypothetical protein
MAAEHLKGMAYHEAGHAVVAWALGLPVGGADILMFRGLLKGISETHGIVLREQGRERARDLLVEHTYSLGRPPSVPLFGYLA